MTIKVFSVAEMAAAERAADATGLSFAQMMETAGRRVAEAVMARLVVSGRRVTVLVGPGNNGGDGLVAGRYLAEAGADVAFYLSQARDGETDENLRRVEQMGLEVLLTEYDQRHRVLHHRLRITDVVVDALLGTGVTRPIGGALAELLWQVKAGMDEQVELRRSERRPALISVATLNRPSDIGRSENSYADYADGHSVNAARINADFNLRTTIDVGFPFVVAVDCPSGLNCDTGALDPLAIPADLTVTFAGPKRGHFRFPGAAACGELVVADIGIAADLPEVVATLVELATAEMARGFFPERPLDGHKGTFGTALIIAGSARYWGAPMLAARGALRAGAGLVALAVPGAIRATVAMQLPEATYPLVPDQETFSKDSVQVLFETAERSKACLVGPGLGDGAADFLERFLQKGSWLPPLVVDADGLNLLAKMEGWPQRIAAGTVLTPHPGEMARLMGVELAAIREADRVELAREKAVEWGHVVVLKGAYTVVAAPSSRAGADGRCVLLPFANPIMGTGGTGDVLAGVIVSLLAQGLTGFEAAVLGGYWHGAAGQLAAEERGNAGLLASELADWLTVVRYRLAGQGINRK